MAANVWDAYWCSVYDRWYYYRPESSESVWLDQLPPDARVVYHHTVTLPRRGGIGAPAGNGGATEGATEPRAAGPPPTVGAMATASNERDAQQEDSEAPAVGVPAEAPATEASEGPVVEAAEATTGANAVAVRIPASQAPEPSRGRGANGASRHEPPTTESCDSYLPGGLIRSCFGPASTGVGWRGAQQEDSTVGVPAEAPATEASEDGVAAAEAATGSNAVALRNPASQARGKKRWRKKRGRGARHEPPGVSVRQPVLHRTKRRSASATGVGWHGTVRPGGAQRSVQEGAPQHQRSASKKTKNAAAQHWFGWWPEKKPRPGLGGSQTLKKVGRTASVQEGAPQHQRSASKKTKNGPQDWLGEHAPRTGWWPENKPRPELGGSQTLKKGGRTASVQEGAPQHQRSASKKTKNGPQHWLGEHAPKKPRAWLLPFQNAFQHVWDATGRTPDITVVVSSEENGPCRVRAVIKSRRQSAGG